MNLDKLAALIIKLSGIAYLFNGLLGATYIPEHVLQADAARAELAPRYHFMLQMLVVRTLLYFGLGLVLMSFWKPIVPMLTRHCDNIFEIKKPSENSVVHENNDSIA